jgi:glucose-6-phosphate 1-dehydrogenase
MTETDTTVVERVQPFEPSAGPVGPCAMVIFGASGDLTKRKLMPAIVNLRHSGLIGDAFAVVGIARQDVSRDDYRKKTLADLNEFATCPVGAKECEWLAARLEYLCGDLEDDALYDRLAVQLADADAQHATAGNYLFYLAVPPSLFVSVTRSLARVGLLSEESGCWRRIVIEKPFGHDLASARALNRELSASIGEHQVFRIDHYLGKETVQNLMIFRFANGIFEPVWNRRYVDHVQISVAETVGVEQRGGYYEQAGALRDMVQNHLFMLLALTAMEPPNSFEAEAVRDERVKVLQAIRPMTPDKITRNVVRGQYGDGVDLEGKPVPAYRREPKVSPTSNVETFVALKVLVENWRWAGVPFYVRTGKRLPRRVSEIGIQFREPPFVMFRRTSVESVEPNWLIIRIQPDEGISLRFQAKVPGQSLQLGTVKMDFRYDDYFGETPSTGYETLLYDCMTGDATLFHRADIVEEGWEKVMPILEAWGTRPPSDFPNYATGTWGPAAADALLARDNRAWRRI